MHVYSYKYETVSTKSSEISVLLGPVELGSGVQPLLVARNTTVPTGLVPTACFKCKSLVALRQTGEQL